MLTRLKTLWHGPRQPLAGVALAAMTGIGLAELWRVRWIRLYEASNAGPFVAAGLFVALAAAWTWRKSNGWAFWGAVATGYAALHLFGSNPVSALRLARRLAEPASVRTAEVIGAYHVLHARGTVLDAPRLFTSDDDKRTVWRFVLRLDEAAVDGDPRRACRAPVNAEWRDGAGALFAGDQLELTAIAANVPAPRNPGELDYAAILRRRGIYSEVRISGVADGRVAGRAPGLRWRVVNAARWFHDWMESRLCLDLRDDPEVCAVVSTTLLGLRGPPGLGDLEGVFQRTGTLHFFAIDGLKLGLVAFLLLRVLAVLGVRRPWQGVLVLPLLVGYTLATGFGAASARAVVVAAVLAGGELVDRPVQPFNSLGAAAAGLLLFDTQQLFELGFQLSFLVVLAILTLAGPLTRWMSRLGAPDPFLPRQLYPRRLWLWNGLRHNSFSLVAVSIAAWIGSLPLMLLYFNLVSPASPAANVAVFPFAFASLALGVLALAGAAFSDAWTAWINNANWLVAKVLLIVVRAFDAIPNGSFPLAAPSHWHWRAPAAEIVVLDLARSRAAYLRAGRTDWLIDAARRSEYQRAVLPCLNARARPRLDGLLLTQGDADHLAAAPLALAELSPRRIIVGPWQAGSSSVRELRRTLEMDHHLTPTVVHSGISIPLAPDVGAQALYPPENVSARAIADRATVLRIGVAGWRILWLESGDGTGARWLLAQGSPDMLASDVLITSGPVSAELLSAVRPRAVVLKRPLKRLDPPPAITGLPIEAVFAQTDSGAVTLRIYPGRIEAEGFVDGKSLTVFP